MILTRGKIVIIVIFIGIAASLAGLFAFTNVERGTLERQIDAKLENAKMKAIDEQANIMTLQVDFLITNKADKTLTISKIDYELFANEKRLGLGFYSGESIPLSGRPALFSNTNTTIPSEFRLHYSDNVKDVWNLLAKSGESGTISWKVKGTAQIESAFSIADVPFESSL